MVVLADPAPALAPATGLPRTGSPADERAARRDLLRQVARLEARLSDAVVSGFPKTPVDHRVPGAAGPQILGLAELEALRDRLAERLRAVQAQLAVAGERQEEARLRLEAMLADPASHRFHQVTRDDLGMPGCGAYQVRPRLGLVGMLMGWWQVKLSSGCPLGPARPQRRTPSGAATSIRPRMGRRSRKRGGTAPARERPAASPTVAAPAAPRTPRRRATLAEAPKAPWSPFPLTELCILISLVLLLVGFFSSGDTQVRALLAGFGLVTLAAGELAVREHFAGYRSHSTLLAGIAAVVAVVPLGFAGVPQIVLIVVAVAVFAAGFGLLRSAFAQRSGGLGFRA